MGILMDPKVAPVQFLRDMQRAFGYRTVDRPAALRTPPTPVCRETRRWMEMPTEPGVNTHIQCINSTLTS